MNVNLHSYADIHVSMDINRNVSLVIFQLDAEAVC